MRYYPIVISLLRNNEITFKQNPVKNYRSELYPKGFISENTSFPAVKFLHIFSVLFQTK